VPVTTAAAEAAVVVPSPRRPALPVDGAVDVLPELFVPEVSQWLSTSASRLAMDGYSWMQAVHWVAGSGLYEPRRHHRSGPRSFGSTTVRVAQELATFLQCRPGIEFLMARTGLCKRSVEYHLRMLRETGLLVWVFQGTRESGGDRKASEFVLMVPPEFDAALGIKCVQRHQAAPDYTRAVVGISEAGRKVMKKLAGKAARKVRRPRRKTSSKPAGESVSQSCATGAGEATDGPVSGSGRCTPMQGGTSTVSTAGSNPLPSEGKLASGKRQSSHRKKSERGPRKLNRVGRRHQLAGELVRRVPWLRSADPARISWVLCGVADAGWTADEVLACLDSLGQEPPAGVRRPSGLLGARLRGMATMPGWRTPEQRAEQTAHREKAVDAARKNRIEQERAKRERSEADWQAPASAGVQRMVNGALAEVKDRQLQERSVLAEFGEGDGPIELEELGRGEVADLRAAAQANPGMITSMIESAGEAYARRLYSNQLVDQALHPVRSTLVGAYRAWRKA
jgi:hypothetical protein